MRYFVILILLITVNVHALECSTEVNTLRRGDSTYTSMHNGGGRWTGAEYYYAKLTYRGGAIDQIEALGGAILSEFEEGYLLEFTHHYLYKDPIDVICKI